MIKENNGVETFAAIDAISTATMIYDIVIIRPFERLVRNCSKNYIGRSRFQHDQFVSKLDIFNISHKNFKVGILDVRIAMASYPGHTEQRSDPVVATVIKKTERIKAASAIDYIRTTTVINDIVTIAASQNLACSRS